MNALRPLLAFVAGASLFTGWAWQAVAGVYVVWATIELLHFTNRASARASASWARRQQQFPATRVESTVGQEGSTVVGAPGRPSTERERPQVAASPYEAPGRW